MNIEKVTMDENRFRWEHNEDEMATDKLADGIRKFAADSIKLEAIIRDRLKQWERAVRVHEYVFDRRWR